MNLLSSKVADRSDLEMLVDAVLQVAEPIEGGTSPGADVADAVADGPRPVRPRQVANGVPMRMAALAAAAGMNR